MLPVRSVMPSRDCEVSEAEFSGAGRSDRLPRVRFLLVVLAGAFLAPIQPAAAVPPPPEQSTANCDTPTYASDHLVCADRGLLTLDRRMVDLLAGGSSSPPTSALHWFEPQDAWFRRRSLCAFSERHAACLRAAYSERIVLLTALNEAAKGQRHPGVRAFCPGAPWGNGSVRLHAPARGPLTIEDARGNLLVVATAIRPQDDWSPFVRFAFQGNGIRIEPRGIPALLCQLAARG